MVPLPENRRMKSILILACFLGLAPLSLFSYPEAEAGLFFDLYPLVEAGPGFSRAGKEGLDSSALLEFFSRPALAVAGFTARSGGFEAAARIDLQQDPVAWLKGANFSNLPLSPDSARFLFGNNFPVLGYAGYEGEKFRLSAGRRRISSGPGRYGLLLSGDNPWHDHAFASFLLPARGFSLGYSFLALSIPSQARSGYFGGEVHQKRIFIHKMEIQGSRLAVSLSEGNVVSGEILDFQDMNPFAVYHNLYRATSNVNLDLELRYAVSPRFFAYGEILLDDMAVGSEVLDPRTNPTAMGFMAGIEWRKGNPDRVRGGQSPFGMSGEDHLLRFEAQGPKTVSGAPAIQVSGKDFVSLRLEGYLCSTYLYRRRIPDERVLLAPWQTWSTHYFLQSGLSGGIEQWPDVDSWLSAPLSPDTAMMRASVEHVRGGTESSAVAEYWIRGAESGAETALFDPVMKKAAWLWPQAPFRQDVSLKVRLVHTLNPAVKLGLSCGIMMGESGLGWSVSAFAGIRVAGWSGMQHE